MREQMPTVFRCEAKSCAFNNGIHCSANAINVGGPEDVCPRCDTFFQVKPKGGTRDVIAGVGACKVVLCGFNKSLACTANGVRIKIHDSHADCATYCVA